ncbi:MAG: arginine--tRNA ligase [Chthoniobacterales bacterium]
METFQALIERAVAAALRSADLAQAGEVAPTADTRFGDYQTNAAMVLAKQRGENPRQLAQNIVSGIDVGEFLDEPQIAGPGFINFRIKPEALAAKTIEVLGDERIGVGLASEPRKIVIDFGSPNVAKPMHVGHIRSTVLGDALARTAQFLGHNVIRDNHIGDWGTQFGMVIWGWKNLLNRDALARDPIAELVRIYKETNERAATDEAVREQCRQELVKLQAHDPENYAIWQECVALSMREFDSTFALLDVRHDIVRGESFYNDRLAAIVNRLLKSGIAELSEGAVVVFFRDIPELVDKPTIIRKRDGGYNYATSDIATVDYRIQDLKRDTLWYVVGAPQTLHFRQIFAIARREGYQADFQHIPFGNVLGEDRKLMKTRSGENVPLREVIEEAISRARRIIEDKNPELEEKDEVAKIIGIGAIKYADLSQYRMTDYVFSWDKMLSFQGNTAPYLQNAYVRIRSIFRKAGQEFTMPDALQISEPAERDLALRVCQFGEIVPSVLNDFRPNVLANYLFELANDFHSFYEACPVLKAEEPVRVSRLALAEATARVLRKGLDLLGIKVPERM